MQRLQTLEDLGTALVWGKKGFVEYNGSCHSATEMGHGEDLGLASEAYCLQLGIARGQTSLISPAGSPVGSGHRVVVVGLLI